MEQYFIKSKNNFMKITGMLVDIHLRDIYPAQITVSDGGIESICRIESAPDIFILPGLDRKSVV